ncbi:hypothetical protein [Pseudomonas sp. SG20052]|uniref:hypothetical protein n=1 Tax=Pseudomonas sp. SG20052 TaxID=3074147 RepID=UPI00287F73C2|nr:hypothetical protein [Pseudomonas sp. SG20052]WNF54221.1 hypothetical protein RHP74_23255 [Pseudomonas sp. SG20052]
MFRNAEKVLCQIQTLAKQMRALEISNLATQLEQLRASLPNENAGPFVLLVAIAQQVLPIKKAYVVPHPLSDGKCWQGNGGWHLVLFLENTPDEIDLINLRNRFFDDGPRSVVSRVEAFSYTHHAERLGQVMAIGIQTPLLELHHD